MRPARRHPRVDAGASAVEYALVVAGIAAVVVTMVFLFGRFVSGSFTGTCEALQAQVQQQGSEC